MIELDQLQRSPETIRDYEARAQRLILPTLGRRPIGTITPADVEKVVGATPGDRNKAYVIALIRKALYFARDKKHYLPETHRNPAAGLKADPKSVRVARALDTPDITSFGVALAAMEEAGEVSPWLANLLRLSLVCGLRPGEARTLT
jgi:integrase